MNILFLSRWFPYPADNGSKIRIYNLLRQLATQHTVDLISFAEVKEVGQIPEPLQAVCRSVRQVPYRPFTPRRLQALAGYFSSRPRSLIDTFSLDFASQADEAAANQHYEVVIASQIDMLPYAERLSVPVRIFEEIELTMLYEQFAAERQPLKRLRSVLTWRKLASYLRCTLPHFQGATVASDRERVLVQSIVPGYMNIEVITNGVDIDYLSGDFGPLEPNSMVYNGALTYQANYDAADFFLADVFPAIKAQCPEACLYITGTTEGVPLENLPNRNGVVFTGYLPDVRPRVAHAVVSVVPLRVGGGTRLKVLESMALGTPVVATTKGAEGLDLVPGRDILIADTTADFASTVLRLLSNPALRQEIALAGRASVKEKYNWDMIGQRYLDFIDRTARQCQVSSDRSGFNGGN